MVIVILEILIAAAFLTNGILLLTGKPSFLLDPRYLENVRDERAFRRAFGANLLVLGAFWIVMSLADALGWLPQGTFSLIYWIGLIALAGNLARIYFKYKK
ncbi:MAG: hypothetical protein AB7C89_00855 [Intestinibacillus sp.]